MRWAAVVLPDLEWPEARRQFVDLERRGFRAAWTYDHLSWRDLRDGPWLGAIPLLAAASTVTSSLRLGPLVASPNYRHPALFAKDVMTIDRISDGRVELGLGAGGTGFDADVLGAERLSPAHRADRFEEFVSALDQLLREPVTTYRGRWFSAVESRTLPGCVQQPRVPFTIAAAGPRALGVAARFGSTWVTFGPMTGGDTADDWFEGLRLQTERLNAVCRDHDRAPESLRRMALLGLEQRWATHSVSALSETIDRLEALGFTDVAVHCPRPWDDARPGVPQAVFDAISDRLVV